MAKSGLGDVILSAFGYKNKSGSWEADRPVPTIDGLIGEGLAQGGRIEIQWRATGYDKVLEDLTDFPRILNYSDNLHLRSTLRADQWIDLLYLGK